MSEFFDTFHFLRPAWLLALIPAVAIWWTLIKGNDPRLGLTDDIAPHLLARMVTSPKERSRFRPVTLLLPIWLIAIFAIAGPSYRRIPSPFAEDASQLLLVVKMTPSMLTSDLQPSRLERVRTKLHDLLQIRKGAGTALITYSGTAHLVMPTTDDGSVIDHMLQALDPDIMPAEGDALAEALAIGSIQLQKNAKAGSILIVADSVEASQLSALAKWREQNTVVTQFLVPLPNEANVQQSGVPAAADAIGASVQQMTPDQQDIKSVVSRANRAIVAAENNDATQWRDDGFWFLPVLALGLLPWCRRGWSIDG